MLSVWKWIKMTYFLAKWCCTSWNVSVALTGFINIYTLSTHRNKYNTHCCRASHSAEGSKSCVVFFCFLSFFEAEKKFWCLLSGSQMSRLRKMSVQNIWLRWLWKWFSCDSSETTPLQFDNTHGSGLRVKRTHAHTNKHNIKHLKHKQKLTNSFFWHISICYFWCSEYIIRCFLVFISII